MINACILIFFGGFFIVQYKISKLRLAIALIFSLAGAIQLGMVLGRWFMSTGALFNPISVVFFVSVVLAMGMAAAFIWHRLIHKAWPWYFID